MKYFIANWKANKNLSETRSWVDSFLKNINKNSQIKQKLQNNLIQVIICPSFPLIYPLKEMLAEQKNIVVGSQDISLVECGTYTGEVTAAILAGLVSYAIIGHSERRKNFAEKDEDLAIKVNLAKQHQIEPIYCIRDEKDVIPQNIRLLAYEPVEAIGTGLNESPEKAVAVKKSLNLNEGIVFIYGGSVDEKNVKDYLATGEIDGFLIGGVSLDAERFCAIIM